MNASKIICPVLFSVIIILVFGSCAKEFKNDDYSAYFGGEVTNPKHRYVLFCKDSEILDTIALKADNTFFIKFDSLTPGLYSFKHEPEYQYVYFDKNDSLMVHMNSKDFDESIIFCGRGDEKNNFLMELYLKNEADKEKTFTVFDYDIPKFNANVDLAYQSSLAFYTSKKALIKWDNKFDVVVKAAVDFHHYSKKEWYPIVHKLRTGEDIATKLPKDFYDFRKQIDFNNTELSGFQPFLTYLSNMLNNIGSVKYHNHYSDLDLALKTNINKLNIADTLIKNEKVKNIILNNIAFTYLLEDQNMVNNQAFLNLYRNYSTDKSAKNEILKIGRAIQLLKTGNTLPEVNLIDLNGKTISSKNIIKKKTVIFFYTENAETHLASAHKKAIEFQSKHLDYQFIAINLDDDQANWIALLAKYKFGEIQEYRCANFEDLKSKWAITKIFRTIILDENGVVNNAFTNLFEVNFEDFLQ